MSESLSDGDCAEGVCCFEAFALSADGEASANLKSMCREVGSPSSE